MSLQIISYHIAPIQKFIQHVWAISVMSHPRLCVILIDDLDQLTIEHHWYIDWMLALMELIIIWILQHFVGDRVSEYITHRAQLYLIIFCLLKSHSQAIRHCYNNRSKSYSSMSKKSVKRIYYFCTKRPQSHFTNESLLSSTLTVQFKSSNKKVWGVYTEFITNCEKVV